MWTNFCCLASKIILFYCGFWAYHSNLDNLLVRRLSHKILRSPDRCLVSHQTDVHTFAICEPLTENGQTLLHLSVWKQVPCCMGWNLSERLPFRQLHSVVKFEKPAKSFGTAENELQDKIFYLQCCSKLLHAHTFVHSAIWFELSNPTPCPTWQYMSPRTPVRPSFSQTRVAV